MICEQTDRQHFEHLRLKARENLALGKMEQSLHLCDAALQWAQEHGDQGDADLATINRSAVLLHLGRGESVYRELQKILMRSANQKCRHLAAYNISFYYESIEAFEKSRFYANIALDHAKKIDTDLFAARTYNLLGNLAIRESQFGDALEYHEQALALFTEEQVMERLAVLASMGYASLASGDLTSGFERLFSVRRSYIRIRLGPGMALGRLHLSFCFGYLEIEKYHQAALHGQAGLDVGLKCADRDLVKKALYLLGETEKQRGDEMAAFKHFAHLQEEFYPDNPLLPDLLLGNPTNQVVNLWA